MKLVVSFCTRCARAIFACWFAMVLAQPVTIRACPIRGGVLEEVTPGTQPSSMDHQHMMAMDMTPHEQAPVHHHERSKCNCVGDSCGSLPAVLPLLGTVVPIPAQQLAQGALFPVVEQSVDEPEYLQPPATAPPISLPTTPVALLGA